jgi:amino acid transporter
VANSLQRSIGPVTLLITGVGSTIGSGWLFGAWRVAKIAGPASLVAWLIGALMVLTVALPYAELGAVLPEAGGMVRYARYSHGTLVGFFSAWANWIAIVSTITIEAVASVQYMASWSWQWSRALYANEVLTQPGLLLAALLIIVYFLINYWSIKLFMRTNLAITVFKVAVPSATVIGLIANGFHRGNFGDGTAATFAPYGWAAVFTAVTTGGIIFAFTGFQIPLALAGEARNPEKSIPLAVVGTVVLVLIIYLLLQFAYLGAVSPADLAAGWSKVDFSSPFAQLAVALNLNWLAVVLYFDAFVSPSGSGINFTAASARMVYAMERNGTAPRICGSLHPLYGTPRPAMWLNLAVAFAFLFVFRGWGSLAEAISVALVISYLTGPVSVMALRRVAGDLKWPIRSMPVIAPVGFVCASLVLYWARWPLTGHIILLTIVGLPIYLYYQTRDGWKQRWRDLQSAWWLVSYLPAMALLSYIGSKSFGGIGLLPFGWDMAVVVAVSLAFYSWGVRSGWRTPYLDTEAVLSSRPRPPLAQI